MDRIAPALRSALTLAVDRVREYHEHQRESGFTLEAEGTLVGMRVTCWTGSACTSRAGRPVPFVGHHECGPAVVAGVREIVAVVPPSGVNDVVLAACALGGVTRIFRIGGAQAVAALAFGTATVPRVDKIVGTGTGGSPRRSGRSWGRWGST